MVDRRIFKAFFSCAPQDLEADPGFWVAFAKELKQRIGERLVNTTFVISFPGDEAAEAEGALSPADAELQSADVLIILLTPRWIESESCRQQYLTFEKIEESRAIGDYVAGYVYPLLARGLEAQKKNLSEPQIAVYSRIVARQHQPPVSFATQKKAARAALIDRIADDIEGMIERRSALTEKSEPPESKSARSQKPREFDAGAYNYENVDFVTDGEVVLGRPSSDGSRDVLAQVEFVERLYVQGQRGRIEFGIRRAFLSVDNTGSGALAKVKELRTGELSNCHYITLHEAPGAITVSIDPIPGKSSLAELPLPPADNENLLSRIATASRDVDARSLHAELIVSLNAEGLFLASDERTISPRSRAAITAIMEAAKSKVAKLDGQQLDDGGRFRRKLVVRVRS